MIGHIAICFYILKKNIVMNMSESESNDLSENLTFAECLERIEAANRKVGLTKGEIITSRDEKVREAQSILETHVLPGFKKWQLPVHLEKPSQMFITVAPPNAKVPVHSHDEGDGIRFIMNGSIKYQDQELTGGDWMFIPAGKKYEIEIGSFGALMCYCYCCCCVRR